MKKLDEVYEVEMYPNYYKRIGVARTMEMGVKANEEDVVISIKDFVELLQAASETGSYKRIASIYDIPEKADDNAMEMLLEENERNCKGLLKGQGKQIPPLAKVTTNYLTYIFHDKQDFDKFVGKASRERMASNGEQIEQVVVAGADVTDTYMEMIEAE